MLIFFLNFQLTRNEDGKFKHAWDEKALGPKPKKERKKREEKDEDGDKQKEGDKPKRIRKERNGDDEEGNLAVSIATAVVKALNKTKK